MISVLLTDEEMQICLDAANSKGANSWSATKKSGMWGSGLGKNASGLDLACLIGGKGEQAISKFLNISADIEQKKNPNPFDFVTVDKKKIEVKTASSLRNDFLYKCQTLKNDEFQYMFSYNQDSKKGILADYLVFCTANSSKTSRNVEIYGFIERDEVLEKFGELHDGLKRNREGKAEWKNYRIPPSALKPISLLQGLVKRIL